MEKDVLAEVEVLSTGKLGARLLVWVAGAEQPVEIALTSRASRSNSMNELRGDVLHIKAKQVEKKTARLDA